MIRCPDCAAECYGSDAGHATAVWRMHVEHVHAGNDQ